MGPNSSASSGTSRCPAPAGHRRGCPLLHDLDVRRLPDRVHPDHGGPINATQIFATMAYDVALVAGRIGEGSAISLFLFPALLGSFS